MIFHHGAGYSGLSFACVAKEVRDMTKGECGVLSLDARRHGESVSAFKIAAPYDFTEMLEGKTTSDSDEDLSIEILEHDFVELLRELFPDSKTAATFVVSNPHSIDLFLKVLNPSVSSSDTVWVALSLCEHAQGCSREDTGSVE
jgi:hypothetical protein